MKQDPYLEALLVGEQERKGVFSLPLNILPGLENVGGARNIKLVLAPGMSLPSITQVLAGIGSLAIFKWLLDR